MTGLLTFSTTDFYDDLRDIDAHAPFGHLTVGDVLEDLRIDPDVDTLSIAVSKRAAGTYGIAQSRHGCVVTVKPLDEAGELSRAFMQSTLQRALAEALVWLIRRTDPQAGYYKTIADDLAFGALQDEEDFYE
jgi:hypothetical protein